MNSCSSPEGRGKEDVFSVINVPSRQQSREKPQMGIVVIL
ncbi:hypothetical protein IFVP182_C260358 [Vibrio parahaemolyticus]